MRPQFNSWQASSPPDGQEDFLISDLYQNQLGGVDVLMPSLKSRVCRGCLEASKHGERDLTVSVRTGGSCERNDEVFTQITQV